MLAQYGPVPEISITFDPAARCYGFSTRLPSLRPHWTIDTFTSLEDVMRWVDPWTERVWEEPGEADDSRILVSRLKKPGAGGAEALICDNIGSREERQMSNGTIHSAYEITAGIDEVVEYLRTGDENRQALMHANLLLTNLMRLLRP